MSETPLCRHCHKAKAVRPRRLCWTCYYRPGVRQLYPTVQNKWTQRGAGLDVPARAPLPAAPTAAVPGSPEKIAELERRVDRKEALWHPDDLNHLDPLQLPFFILPGLPSAW